MKGGTNLLFTVEKKNGFSKETSNFFGTFKTVEGVGGKTR